MGRYSSVLVLVEAAFEFGHSLLARVLQAAVYTPQHDLVIRVKSY